MVDASREALWLVMQRSHHHGFCCKTQVSPNSACAGNTRIEIDLRREQRLYLYLYRGSRFA